MNVFQKRTFLTLRMGYAAQHTSAYISAYTQVKYVQHTAGTDVNSAEGKSTDFKTSNSRIEGNDVFIFEWQHSPIIVVYIVDTEWLRGRIIK